MKLKTLAMTGLAVTLGLASVGTTTMPAYAATKVSPHLGSNEWDPSIEEYKDQYMKNNMLQFAPFHTTGATITSQDHNLKSIDYAINDNSQNDKPAKRKTATKSYSHTDEMTITSSTETSLGTEFSTSMSFEGIANVTAKFTAGMKISSGTSQKTSDTTTITYGGDEMDAGPHEIVRVDYYLEEIKSSGFMNTGTRITEIGDNLEVWSLVGDDPPNHRTGDVYSPGHKTGADVYKSFKDIEEINKKNRIAFAQKDMGIWNISKKGRLSDKIFIDEVAKTVSTAPSQIPFDGVAGTGLTIKTTRSDGKSNKVLSVKTKTIPLKDLIKK